LPQRQGDPAGSDSVMDKREEAIWGRGFTMSLESGPAQWWHRRGPSGQRVASPAAFMAFHLSPESGRPEG